MKRLLLSSIFFISTLGCDDHAPKSTLIINKEKLDTAGYLPIEISRKRMAELQSLYDLADSNSTSGLRQADQLLLNYSHSNSKTDELHYFKGEILYKLGNYKESLQEFNQCVRDTTINTGIANIAIASNYMQFKKYDSAFFILSKYSRSNYDHQFILGTYHELMGDKGKAKNLYDSLYNQKWVHNGQYKNLEFSLKERLACLKKSRCSLINLPFRTNNPKSRSQL